MVALGIPGPLYSLAVTETWRVYNHQIIQGGRFLFKKVHYITLYKPFLFYRKAIERKVIFSPIQVCMR
ncbi:hypothetical protein D9M68_546430 [compost metagenome]